MRTTARFSILPLAVALACASCTTEADRAVNQYRLRKEQGFIADRDGDAATAEIRYKEALAVAEKTWGENHPNTATSLSDLGLLYHYRGQYRQAEPLLARALAARLKLLGADDISVADSLTLSAANNRALGKLDEAERQFREALAIRERKHGPDDLDLARAKEHLATLLWARGDSDEVAVLLRDALTVREKHPDKAKHELERCRSNLAAAYYKTGRLKDAEKLYRMTLLSQEARLGADDVAVASTLDALARVLKDAGASEEAVRLRERAGRIRMAAVSPELRKAAEQAARAAAMHLYDRSYTTYKQSQLALRNGELGAAAVAQAKKEKLLAADDREMEATAKAIEKTRQVGEVKIDRIAFIEPDRNGLLSFEIGGTVTMRSAKAQERRERFQLACLVAFRTDDGEAIVTSLRTLPEAERAGTTGSAPPAQAALKR